MVVNGRRKRKGNKSFGMYKNCGFTDSVKLKNINGYGQNHVNSNKIHKLKKGPNFSSCYGIQYIHVYMFLKTYRFEVIIDSKGRRFKAKLEHINCETERS